MVAVSRWLAEHGLGHHCTQAGFVEKAIDYWYRAGRRALARSAMAEAVAQLNNGLEVLEGLAGGPERQRRELDLQLALGQALIAARGFATPETGRAYARACELCRQVGNAAEFFQALYGKHAFHFERAELHVAYEVAQELLQLAEERDDGGAQALGHRLVGSDTLQLGHFAEARMHLEQGLALYDAGRDQSSAQIYAVDTRVLCSTRLAHALLALGYAEQAGVRNEEALAYAQQLAHPGTLALALWQACVFHKLCREPQRVAKLAEAHIELAAEHGFPQALASGEFDRGWVIALAGRHDEGVAQMRRALAAGCSTGAERGVSTSLADLAEALGRAGETTGALDLLSEALARVAASGERWYEAELHRLKGEALRRLSGSDPTEAEACFRKAIAVAQQQEASLWRLRAATSLACLWRDRGNHAEAHNLLAPVYGWFTEGFDTADLIEAKALLDELA